MMQVIKSNERHTADHGWLLTHWHFSFSDYHDPNNMNWGALRVFNDDIIRAGGGFGAHPHRDMEIVTYVLEGELEHQDNLGNKGVIHPGEVQVMSAGRGIMHAEYNASKEKDVHLIQLWILPKHRNNTPRWEQRRFSAAERAGKLLPVVSGGSVEGTLTIDQDAVILVGALEKNQAVRREIGKGRLGYLFVISGKLVVNGKELLAGDQARIRDEREVSLVASEKGEVIFLDLPEV